MTEALTSPPSKAKLLTLVGKSSRAQEADDALEVLDAANGRVKMVDNATLRESTSASRTRSSQLSQTKSCRRNNYSEQNQGYPAVGIRVHQRETKRTGLGNEVLRYRQCLRLPLHTHISLQMRTMKCEPCSTVRGLRHVYITYMPVIDVIFAYQK